MTTTSFSDNVVVTGSRDVTQIEVKGTAAQTQSLQAWEDSASDVLAQISSDGRFQIGDDGTSLGLSSPDALIEAHRDDSSTSKPKRGFHSLGRISDTLTNVAQWIVQELEVRGSNNLSALQTALRVRASNMNTGTPVSGAEIRAADIEVVNDTTAGSAALPLATGLQVAVTNASGKTITQATGLHVKMDNSGTITTPYAIYTEGDGVTHLEDYIEVKRPAATPGTPATDFIRLYSKTDGNLYAKDWNGVEYNLTSGGGGSSPSYLGYDAVGSAGNDGFSSYYTICKQVVTSSEGWIMSISGYLTYNVAGHVSSLGAAIFEDSSGAPGNIIAYAPFYPVYNVYFNSASYRWFHIPISTRLPAGTYWISIINADANGGISLSYDSGGSDVYFTASNPWTADGGVYTLTTTSKKYSIRADFLPT